MGVNDDLMDRQISHQVHTLRLSTGMANRMVALLERSESDLIGKLFTRLEKIKRRGFDTGPETTKRLEALIVQLQIIRHNIYGKVGEELRSELEELALYERNWQIALLDDTVAAVSLKTLAPPMAQIRSAAVSRPFQGRLLKEWVKDMDADDARRLRDAIRIGFVEGEPTAQIVSRVKDTMDTSNRHLATIVRTAVNHTANAARSSIARGNEDIIKGVRWVATLDGRTSPICRARDGKVFDLDKGPRPPAHPNCRSTITYVLKGLPGTTGTRASFDGQVPADLTYGDWLRKQPRSFIEDVMGKERARLFLKGRPIDKFVDRSGKQYTLDQLRQAERKAA